MTTDPKNTQHSREDTADPFPKVGPGDGQPLGQPYGENRGPKVSGPGSTGPIEGGRDKASREGKSEVENDAMDELPVTYVPAPGSGADTVNVMAAQSDERKRREENRRSPKSNDPHQQTDLEDAPDAKSTKQRTSAQPDPHRPEEPSNPDQRRSGQHPNDTKSDPSQPDPRTDGQPHAPGTPGAPHPTGAPNVPGATHSPGLGSSSASQRTAAGVGQPTAPGHAKK